MTFGSIAAAAILATRDWRAGLAVPLSGLFAGTMVAWLAAHLAWAPLSELWRLLVVGGGAASLPSLLLFSAMTAHRVFGDGVESAWGRALDDCGAPVIFAGVAIFAAILTSAIGFPLAAAVALTWLAGLVAAFVLTPALASALDHLFPQRRSVEELYGKPG